MTGSGVRGATANDRGEATIRLGFALVALIGFGPAQWALGLPQEPAPSEAALRQPAQELAPDSPLAKGLAAIVQERLRADLEFFASDAMRGRNTPSPELRIAALFLKSRMQSLGFQPGAENGWFQDYPIFTQRLDPAQTSLVASFGEQSRSLGLGEDYFFQLPNQSYDLALEGQVLCVGEGSKEDLEGLDLQGKWALVLDRGKFLSKAIKACQGAGAIGVLASPGPTYERDSYAQKYRLRSLDQLAASKPRLTNSAGEDAPFPLIMLGRDAAKGLWVAAGSPLSAAGYPATGVDPGFQLREQRKLRIEQQSASNLCAFWPGSDPQLAKETMILSAHYDHVGVKDGVIYNGADDNASGTSGLLALADALVAYGPMQRSVLLLWVSGEEKGLWGSKVWVDNPWLPESCHAVLNINIDMIGRAPGMDLCITPSMDHPSFNSLSRAAYDLAAEEGFGDLISQDEFWSSSDHKNFAETLGLPVIFLSAGDHEDYHKPTDTAEKIDVQKSTRIVRLVLRVLDRVQAAPLSSGK